MPEYPQLIDAQQILQKKLSKLTNSNIKSQLSKQFGTKSISFDEAILYIDRLLKLYVDFSKCTISPLSLDRTIKAQEHVDEVTKLFQSVIDFDPKPPNAHQEKELVIEKLSSVYENHFDFVTPLIAYLSYSSADFDQVFQKVSQAQNEIEHINNDLEQKKKELDLIMESARSTVAKIGVAKQAAYFAIEAKNHKKIAQCWLVATISMALLTIGFAGWVWLYYTTANVDFSNTAKLIQVSIAKLFILSILYFGLVWCSKNYRTHRHNFIVNRHRQNSLSTFEAFVLGTNDEATKNAVLLRSTEAVFSPVSSGYSSSESECSGSPQILEIIRSAVDTTKK